jgi:hypothetical protein
LRRIEAEIEAKVQVEKNQDVIQTVRNHPCLPQAGTSDIRREMKIECKASGHGKGQFRI